MPHITESNRAEWLGSATIDPRTPVVASSYGTWTIRYVTGKYGVDDGGAIKIAFKLASDWGTPQMADPFGDNYVTIRTDGHAQLRARYEQRGYLRPYFRTLHIDVYDGSLVEGDQVLVTFGDTSSGSRGSLVQSFIDNDFRFVVAVECFQTGVFYEVPAETSLKVVGAAATSLVVIGQSDVEAGKDTWLLVKAQDEFGNPVESYRGGVTFCCPDALGLPGQYQFAEADEGVHRFEGIVFGEPGCYRIAVSDGSNHLSASSNPIEVYTQSQEKRLNVYWGDFHGQTKNSVGTGTVEEYFDFGQRKAALDFCAHNANDFQVHREHWQEVKEMTRKFHKPGEFVTFLGSEWSGSTPSGGDHNIYYLDDEAPLHRSSHWQVPDKSDEHLDCYPVSELYEAVRKDGLEAMVIPHVGGRYANLDYHAPDLEPVVEVCSAHGRFEWILKDAITRGYKVGVVANGDDHTGRTGASYPTRGHFHVRGGLTAVYAEAKTREDIWKAIKSRRCYATSGERILLDVRTGEHFMGEEVVVSGPVEFKVKVVGTTGITRCDVKRGLETVFTYVPEVGRDDKSIRVAWGGARLRSRDRHSRWNGGLTLQGGQITGVKGFAFDAPWKGVRHWDESTVEWHSSTAGDIDGVLVNVDAPDEAILSFDTATARFQVTLGEVRRTGYELSAGLLDQHVSVSAAPARPNPLDAAFTYIDQSPPQGTTPYYVTVMQDDGEMAWSSPIYVVRG